MTEIDKLFENAGIKKQYCGWLDMGDLDCQPQYVRCNSITEWKDAVFASRFGESEEEPEHKYPPFTAEKQIELIKLLGNVRDYIVELDKFKGVYYVGCREAGSNNKHWGSHNLFEEALAELINNLWQSLTDQEKEEIRRILND